MNRAQEEPIYVHGSDEESAPAPVPNPHVGGPLTIRIRSLQALSDLRDGMRLALSLETTTARAAAIRILSVGSEGRRVEELVPALIQSLEKVARMKEAIEDIGCSIVIPDETINLVKDALIMRAHRTPSTDIDEFDDHFNLLIGLCSTVLQASDVGNEYYGRLIDIFDNDLPDALRELEDLLERANRILDAADDILREDDRSVRRRRFAGVAGFRSAIDSVERRIEEAEQNIERRSQGRM